MCAKVHSLLSPFGSDSGVTKRVRGMPVKSDTLALDAVPTSDTDAIRKRRTNGLVTHINHPLVGVPCHREQWLKESRRRTPSTPNSNSPSPAAPSGRDPEADLAGNFCSSRSAFPTDAVTGAFFGAERC